MSTPKDALPAASDVCTVHQIRGHRVILDSDIAPLYGVNTAVLVRVASRNRRRIPEDFMLRLSAKEFAALEPRTGAKGNRARRRRTAYAFTGLGVALLSTLLHSEEAILVNIGIVRSTRGLFPPLAEHQESRRPAPVVVQDRRVRIVLELIDSLVVDEAKLSGNAVAQGRNALRGE